MSAARAVSEPAKTASGAGPGVRKLRPVKRVLIAIVGGVVTLVGIALIVLPGPAFIVIPIGLSILATQFDWAKGLLKKARAAARRLKSKETSRA